jgi:phosphoglycolate phosphatase
LALNAAGTDVSFDAVLFDLDGTLLDTLEDIADAVNRVLARHHYPTYPIVAYRYFVGEGARTLVRRVLPDQARNEETTDRLYAEFREEYARNWNATTRPYDGVPAMLDGLVERGLKIAVLSNKPDDFTRKCVRELLGKWTFDAVLGQQDKIPPKPDPAGAFHIVKKVGVPPERILYAGDSSIDMQTATAARMFPVGVLWGFRTREELESSGARAIIEAPGDLLALLPSVEDEI